jgi:hypothetical protein
VVDLNFQLLYNNANANNEAHIMNVLKKISLLRLPKTHKTNDGKFYIKPNHKHLFRGNYFHQCVYSSKYVNTRSFIQDLEEAKKQLDVSDSTLFTVTKYGLQFMYDRIENVKEHDHLHRSHFLPLVNDLPQQHLLLWIDLYNKYENNPSAIIAVLKFLDAIYENDVQCKDDYFTAATAKTQMLTSSSLKELFELFSFDTYVEGNVHQASFYPIKKAKLKVMLSVFCELSNTIDLRGHHVVGDYDNVSNFRALSDYLQKRQHTLFSDDHSKQRALTERHA